MKRRGEISMEVIIIAAIALLVLVILSILLVRGGLTLGKGTSCQGVGGTCESDCSLLDGTYQSEHACQGSTVCCVPIFADPNEE